MANVLHKTADPTDYRVSVHTPDYPTGTWFVDPDVSAVSAVPTKYWKRPLTDPVVEMSQAEKDAVDAAEDAASVASNRAAAAAEVDPPATSDSVGVRTRALIELFNKRDNYLVNRVAELQTAFDSVKASSGPADNIRNAIPASWLATNTRTKPQAVQEYKDDINAGNQDT